jgi:hypothetical protein
MALLSPGVEVTVVDQSQYIPASVNSVPYILLATAQNKVSGTGVGVAAGTLQANANRVYLITSQRDLSATFGVPFFYKTTAGTPINGYELNEYGLLAAYSALGITNRAYIQRVDVDLSALTASLIRPVGTPPNGTYWLDTTNSQWGLYQWNQTTAAFTNQVPTVIVDSTQLVGNTTVPLQSIGSIGDYAITATNITNPGYYKRGGPTTSQTSSTVLSDAYNTWVEVGSDDWKTAWTTVQGTSPVTTLTANNIVYINATSVAVPVSPNNTLEGLSDAINSANITGVYSAFVDSKLQIYADSTTLGANPSVGNATGNGTVATLTFSTLSQAPYAVGSSITSNATAVPATSSTAKLLRIVNTVPAAVTTVTGTISNVVCGTPYNYTITRSPLASSYVITAPTGSVVTSASNTTNTTNVLTTSDLIFTVVYPNLSTVTPKTVVISAVNGFGASVTNKTLTITNAPCNSKADSAIEEAISFSNTSVYPNPATSEFNIDIDASKDGNIQMSIYSINGIMVLNSKSINLEEGRNTISENISNLSNGIYIVRLVDSSNKEVMVKKLIKN